MTIINQLDIRNNSGTNLYIHVQQDETGKTVVTEIISESEAKERIEKGAENVVPMGYEDAPQRLIIDFKHLQGEATEDVEETVQPVQEEENSK
jgi:hypothetical protein